MRNGNSWFERRLRTRKLTARSMERQSRIVRLAIEHFGGMQNAVHFLNGVDPDLGGPPLAIAIASRSGFNAVLRRLSGPAGDAGRVSAPRRSRPVPARP